MKFLRLTNHDGGRLVLVNPAQIQLAYQGKEKDGRECTKIVFGSDVDANYYIAVKESPESIEKMLTSVEEVGKMTDLKPCPFCGKKVELIKEPLWHGSHGYHDCYE